MTVLSVLAPMAVALRVWLPLVSHYSVRTTRVADDIVTSARIRPADSLLRDIRDLSVMRLEGGRANQVSVADSILRGLLALPGLPAASIRLPFSPEDLDHLPPDLRLWFAGYTAPDFLLAAFVDTGREEFLALACDMIVAWNRYERRARVPKGYLWNDHAIAARAHVLGEFWRIYRQRADYRLEVGRAVLEQAARYRGFLADPRHFTFATNHGLIQNLGLLQLGLSFPTLPHGDRYRQMAVERLDEQISFLLDVDGVIRENSAGYQAFGLEILGMVFRCLTLADVPVPRPWAQKYERGLLFLGRLKRPDGTLPAIGDTDGSSVGHAPLIVELDGEGRSGILHPKPIRRPDQELSVQPAAGYWVEWNGLPNWPDQSAISQTVVAWTFPPAPSHKHADELSALIWSHGVSWLTSVGYWPYTADGRKEAESWAGSNAPHRANEPRLSSRRSRLRGYASTTEVSVLDLERCGPGTYLARRQLVHLKPDLWIIIDHVRSDTTGPNETVWTIAPGIAAGRARTSASYMLTAPSGATARLSFLGSAGTAVRDYRGSFSPFAGWHVVRSVPQPAPAIVVEQPAGDAMLAVVLSTSGSSSPDLTGEPRVDACDGAEAWTIQVPLASGELTVSRIGSEVTIDRAEGGAAITVHLAVTAAPAPEIAAIAKAFDRTAARYPVFRSRTGARAKVTVGLVILVVAQEVVLHLLRRGRSTYLLSLRLASLPSWATLGAWLHLSSLRSRGILDARDW